VCVCGWVWVGGWDVNLDAMVARASLFAVCVLGEVMLDPHSFPRVFLFFFSVQGFDSGHLSAP
jgi:hypothetical protein